MLVEQVYDEMEYEQVLSCGLQNSMGLCYFYALFDSTKAILSPPRKSQLTSPQLRICERPALLTSSICRSLGSDP